VSVLARCIFSFGGEMRLSVLKFEEVGRYRSL